MVTASHIVAWAEAPEHRVNPGNGLCLNALHEAAFDRHLVTFDAELRFVIGRRLRQELPKEDLATAFLKYEGQTIRKPEKHEVARDLLGRHRQLFTELNRASWPRSS